MKAEAKHTTSARRRQHDEGFAIERERTRLLKEGRDPYAEVRRLRLLLEEHGIEVPSG